MKYFIERALWFCLYLIIIIAPVLLLVSGRRIPGQSFWWEFSVGLGFLMLMIMGLQFALTARFKKATLPFGIDIIYHFHRYMGLMLVLFIFLHPAVFFIKSPGMIVLLNPLKAPLAFRAGLVSALALLFLIVISLGRRRVSLEYDYWRTTHVLLSILAVGAGIIHIRGFGFFSAFSWKSLLWTGLILLWVLLVFFMRGIKPYLISKNPYVVEEVRAEPGDSYTLSIKPERPRAHLKFEPGQFAWLTIWHSPFALREHPFSIASSAERSPHLEFTIKERGDFTRRIKSIKPGLRVYVDAPYGSFSLDRYPAPGYVFIAGGIGIAPIMSMLRTLRDRGDKRPLLLFYSNKRYERAAFTSEIEELKGKLDLKVVHIIENPDSAWQGERGFINRELMKKYLPPEKALFHYFICGPDAMMDSVEHSLYALGISISKFHSEIFNLV